MTCILKGYDIKKKTDIFAEEKNSRDKVKEFFGQRACSSDALCLRKDILCEYTDCLSLYHINRLCQPRYKYYFAERLEGMWEISQEEITRQPRSGDFFPNVHYPIEITPPSIPNKKISMFHMYSPPCVAIRCAGCFFRLSFFSFVSRK